MFASRPVVKLNPLRRNGIVVRAKGVAAYYNHTGLVSGESLNFPDGVHAVNVAVELKEGVFLIVSEVPGSCVGLLVPVSTTEGAVRETLNPHAGGGDLLCPAGAAVGIAFNNPIAFAKGLGFEAFHGRFNGLAKAACRSSLVVELSLRRDLVDVKWNVAGGVLVLAGNEIFRRGQFVGLDGAVAWRRITAGGYAKAEREEDK